MHPIIVPYDRSPHEAVVSSSPPLRSAALADGTSVATAHLSERPSLLSLPSTTSSTSTSSWSQRSTASSRTSPSSSTSSLHTATADSPGTISRTMTITPQEYDALPPAIQQKYFSSLERLRIAQDAVAQRHKRHSSKPARETLLAPSRPSIGDMIRPSTSHSFGTLSSGFSSIRTSPARAAAELNVDEALRFRALPDKVKRAHFNLEELALLTASSERVLDLSCVLVGTTRPAASTNNPSRDMTMEKDWADRELELLDDMTYDSDTVSNDGVPCVDDCNERKASITPSVSSGPHPLPPILESRTHPREGSYRRRRFTSMLAPLPLPPPRLMPIMPPLPVIRILDDFQAPPMPSAPKHYTDFDARSQLRECIMSPEKFDEALEFGFPVNVTTDQRSTSADSKSDQSIESEVGELSLSGSAEDNDGQSDQDEDQSDDYNDDPLTPTADPETHQTFSFRHKISMDSGVAIPIHLTKVHNSSIRSLTPEYSVNREMTLKLSLTRQDLRAPEEKLYSLARSAASGVEVGEDPLTLDPLPVCEDHTGAKGAFAVSEKSRKRGLAKAWKSIVRY